MFCAFVGTERKKMQIEQTEPKGYPKAYCVATNPFYVPIAYRHYFRIVAPSSQKAFAFRDPYKARGEVCSKHKA